MPKIVSLLLLAIVIHFSFQSAIAGSNQEKQNSVQEYLSVITKHEDIIRSLRGANCSDFARAQFRLNSDILEADVKFLKGKDNPSALYDKLKLDAMSVELDLAEAAFSSKCYDLSNNIFRNIYAKDKNIEFIGNPPQKFDLLRQRARIGIDDVRNLLPDKQE